MPRRAAKNRVGGVGRKRAPADRQARLQARPEDLDQPPNRLIPDQRAGTRKALTLLRFPATVQLPTVQLGGSASR